MGSAVEGRATGSTGLRGAGDWKAYVRSIIGGKGGAEGLKGTTGGRAVRLAGFGRGGKGRLGGIFGDHLGTAKTQDIWS